MFGCKGGCITSNYNTFSQCLSMIDTMSNNILLLVFFSELINESRNGCLSIVTCEPACYSWLDI